MIRQPRGGGVAVLIGFMGAGKTSVGRVVAKRLGAEFVDLDMRIESAAGCSVREIFARQGEGAFREMEKDAIRDAVSVPGRVVAAGGGAFLDPGNRILLKRYARVVFLDASPEAVLERLSRDASRPLLQGADRERTVRELLARRRPSYAEADVAVCTDGLSVAEVADRVTALLTGRMGPKR